tara:strand:+ start:736 stop:1113 length:378 start_codon:yes stop_codon:yes gene_type:complete
MGAEDRAMAADTVARFRALAVDAGYDIDDLRMTFAGMAVSMLTRTDMSPAEMSRSIQAIRDAASLMGVDSKPVRVSKKLEDQDADLIVDAINPRIEGLLEAIERGNDATDEPAGAGDTPTTYQEV